MSPGAGMVKFIVEYRLQGALPMPIEFGPINLIPFSRAVCTIFSSSFFPSWSISPNPADTTSPNFTPALAHSSITCGTVAAPTQIIARSTLSGTLFILSYAFIPCVSVSLGFIG